MISGSTLETATRPNRGQPGQRAPALMSAASEREVVLQVVAGAFAVAGADAPPLLGRLLFLLLVVVLFFLILVAVIILILKVLFLVTEPVLVPFHGVPP